MRNFRIDRIAKIRSREKTPVSLTSGGCVVIHVLPLGAFTEKTTIDIKEIYDSNVIPIIGQRPGYGTKQINFDGIVTFVVDSKDKPFIYTQFFRTGAVEAVEISPTDQNGTYLVEGLQVTRFLEDYRKFIAKYNIKSPYYVFLSYVNVRGSKLFVCEKERVCRGHDGKPRPSRSQKWLSKLHSRNAIC